MDRCLKKVKKYLFVRYIINDGYRVHLVLYRYGHVLNYTTIHLQKDWDSVVGLQEQLVPTCCCQVVGLLEVLVPVYWGLLPSMDYKNQQTQ